MSLARNLKSEKIPLRLRVKMILPAPLRPPAEWVYGVCKFICMLPFRLINLFVRPITTNIDRFLNRFTSREFIMRKEVSKYELYHRIEGHVSDVGYRLALDKACDLLDFTTILDVGCAQGFSVNEFLKRGYDAKGCDISKYVVDHPIQELRDKKVLFPALASALPFSDNSFDLVFCTDVMEHIPEKEVLYSLREMKRVTQRYLFFTICLHPSTHRNVVEYHATVFARLWWEDRFAEAGLVQLCELEKKIQGSEEMSVGGKVVPVEYFIYTKPCSTFP